MNQDESARPHPARNGGGPRVVAVTGQWDGAELALKVARHNYEGWLAVGQQEESRVSAAMRAYATHEALHQAACAIAVLIDTFRTEAAALIATRSPGGEVSTPRR